MSGTQHRPVAPDKVDAVLLADGWHNVALGSFTVGVLSFGNGDDRGVLGYCFEEISNGSLHRSATLAGPLDAVLAVRQIPSRRPLQQQAPPGQTWSSNGHATVHQHPSRYLKLTSQGAG
jgi:hypothetical protein